MYKVFLADDEAAMRLGVRNNIDWDNSDFILAGEAPDGEMALSLMQEIMPDILITDVRMPFMDGIELSRRVRKTMPWIKIIILSGHDEFEYAKQAISIGVEEYLLKPVTSGILLETLKEVASRIRDDKERARNIEDLKNDAMKNRVEKLLSDILYGNIQPEEAVSAAETLNLPVLSDYYLVMIVELHCLSPENYNLLSGACAYVSGIVAEWGNSLFLSQGPDRIVCILKSKDQAAIEEEAFTMAGALKYEVERFGLFTVTAAIGSAVPDLRGWPKSLTDADMTRRSLNLINKKQIVSIRDISPAKGSKYDDIIAKAKAYIEENYDQPDITLHTVASEVHISPNHFSTVFRQETGETFINWLTALRVERATALLETTGLGTADIGYAVGYNDTHYFSYVFKKNTGKSPKEYRASLTV